MHSTSITCKLSTRALAFISLVIAPAITLPLRAQSLESVAIAAGATNLPLSSAWSGGLNATTFSLSINVGFTGTIGLMLKGRALVPTEGRSATPVCAPDRGGCVEFKTPDALLNVAGGAYLLTSGQRLRTTLAGGLLTAAGLRGADNTSSPTLQAGLQYAPWPARRVSPFVELHLLHTTRDIAGIRTLVLPSVGIAF